MTVAPTPYVAPKASHIVLPGQDPSGQYILSVLVKRTYDIVDGTACRRAGKDQKIHTADVPYGDPLNSSIKFESDFVPFKLATDIVVNAKCYAPGGRAVTHLMASVRVGKDRRFPESSVLTWLAAREEGRRVTGRVVSIDRRLASG